MSSVVTCALIEQEVLIETRIPLRLGLRAPSVLIYFSISIINPNFVVISIYFPRDKSAAHNFFPPSYQKEYKNPCERAPRWIADVANSRNWDISMDPTTSLNPHEKSCISSHVEQFSIWEIKN